MIEFSYIPPWWSIAFAALAFVGLFAWSFRRAKGRPSICLRALLIAIRFLAIALVVLCLLDPQWVQTIRRQPKSRVAVLLDTSRSMSIRDLPGGRLAAAKEWITHSMEPVVPAGIALSTFTFGQTVSPLPKLDTASPTGAVTALSDALENILAMPSEDPLAGVILVSDGIDTESQAPESVARSYRRKGIPIHTVLAGTTNEMRDVVMENVQVKRAVPNEAPTRVAVALHSPGFAGKTVSLEIRGPKGVVAAREVRLNGGAQTEEIEITPRQKGFQIYQASVSALEGEWLASNNRRSFGLEVTDPTIRVLYMEGTPQTPSSPIPEWKYLKDAFESDPNIKVTVLYRQFGAKGQRLNTIDSDPDSGEKIYPVEHPTKGFPRTLAGLLEYDVVIHSDIRKESFSAEQLKNIATLVEQHGGGFVMIGGNSAFGKGGYHKTILDRIIPVAMQSSEDSEASAFHLVLPRAALAHPLINFGATPAETELIWTKKFPRLYGFNRVDHAKPAAAVLALNGNYVNGAGQGILIAVQEVGRGRSMAFTSDTTRNWGRDFETLWGEPRQPGPLTEDNCDSRYYRRFWVNAVRWLASGKAGKTNQPVTLELAQTHCLPGQSVAASVKVRDEHLTEISDAEVTLAIASGATTNSPVKARYDAGSGSYIADLQAPSAGSCIIKASARRHGADIGADRQLLVSEAADLEMTDVRARPEFMASLARRTQGDYFTIGATNSLSPAYAFAHAPPPVVEYRRKSFWDKPLWMGAILAVLAAEWAVRRTRGLA